MYKKILFATNFSEVCSAAFDQALDLAKKYSATLYISHFIESPYKLYRQFVYTEPGSTEALGFMTPEVKKIYEDHINKNYGAKLKGFSNFKFVVAPGHPHVEILRLARKEGMDLIIMGASSERKEPLTISNELEEVVRRARCPVMVVTGPATFTMADKKTPLRELVRAGGR